MRSKSSENKIKKCNNCQMEVSIELKKCPNCGKKLGLSTLKKLLIILVILLVIVTLIITVFFNQIESKISLLGNTYKDINNATTFKKGDTFENSYIKLTMIDINKSYIDTSEFSYVKDGYKLVSATFKIENISNEEQIFSYAEFNCLADEQKVDKYYGTYTNKTNFSHLLERNATETEIIYCEVPINTTKITILYNTKWLFDSDIEFILE